MATAIYNEYRVTKQDGSEVTAVRENIIGAAKDFEDVADPQTNPVVQIQKTRSGINVAFPEQLAPVHFAVQVEPQAAIDAGCIAAPSAFTVVEGTAVVFEAIPGAGFDFTGWFLDAPVNPEDSGTFDPTLPVSTNAAAVLVVTSPGPGLERKIFARFEPSVP